MGYEFEATGEGGRWSRDDEDDEVYGGHGGGLLHERNKIRLFIHSFIDCPVWTYPVSGLCLVWCNLMLSIFGLCSIGLILDRGRALW